MTPPEKQEQVDMVDLPHTGLSAKIVLIAIGQQEPKDGDAVMVCGYVCLPCTSESPEYIAEPLRFWERVFVADEELRDTWGHYTTEIPSLAQIRYRRRTFTAPTWREAADSAQTWAKAALDRLVKVLEKRHQAFVAAGDFAWAPEESSKPWKRILDVDPLPEFSLGDRVIYRGRQLGVVLEVEPRRVKVSFDGTRKISWVKPTSLRGEDEDY